MSTSAEPASDAEPRLNLLSAYPYMSKARIDLIRSNFGNLRFLLDSGAFTAWKAGQSIKLDDYCTFLEKLPFRPWRYFALDVVGDPLATRKNYELMLKRGLAPVPVFTRGEELSVLKFYYSTSEVVAFGGLVGTGGNRGFVNGVMKHVGKRKCHWLGFTSLAFLKKYRPYMVDTSSWEAGARYATIRLYVGRGRQTAISKSTFTKRPSDEILETVASYGVDPLKLAKNASWAGSFSANRILNAASSLRMSLDIQRSLGTLYFMGVANQGAGVNILLERFEFEKQRGFQ